MNRIASLAALCFVSAVLMAGPSAAQAPHTKDHGFSGAEQWAKVFDDPKRDASQKPREVIDALALKPGSVIADIGSGTGYFAVRFARMAPKARVYGVDIEPDMVKYLAERAEREGLKNLTAVKGTPTDPRLPEKADLVVMVNVFHHVADRERYFRNLRGSLKPGGRVAIIDHRMDSGEGPPKSARLAPERVKAELESAGYALVQEHGILPTQYFLVFRPAAPDAPYHDWQGAFHGGDRDDIQGRSLPENGQAEGEERRRRYSSGTPSNQLLPDLTGPGSQRSLRTLARLNSSREITVRRGPLYIDRFARTVSSPMG